MKKGKTDRESLLNTLKYGIYHLQTPRMKEKTDMFHIKCKNHNLSHLFVERVIKDAISKIEFAISPDED